MSTVQIRPGTPADLPALVDLQNAASPDHATTLSFQEHQERTRRPDLPFGRLVAEQDGSVIGVAEYSQPETITESGYRRVSVTVHPDARRWGTGDALYTALLAELGPQRPLKLNVGIWEDQSDALHFADSRGYAQVASAQYVQVELARLDRTQRESSLATAQAAGYELTTFARVADRLGLDAAWQKYYDLDTDASRDEPQPPGETMQMPPLERYREHKENRPDFDASLSFVAVRGGELAALSELTASPVPSRMDTGFTGVARAHRGHRLAWALKYTALEEAIRRGATHVRTASFETNLPMRRINQGLGFLPVPAFLILTQTLE